MAKVGRPLKFNSVEEFEVQAKDYFETIPREKWTITGLAEHLGTFRDLLMDYQAKDDFSDAIKHAKQQIEMAYEESLRKNGRAGDIFGLKNFGWRDKTETDVTTKGESLNSVPDPIAAAQFAEFLKNK